MTKEIAQKLAGLTPRNLVVVVSRWSTMPIKENIDTAPKFNVLSRLSELLDMISPHSYLELGRFAKDCGIIANVYRDAGGNRRVTLIRETRKYRSAALLTSILWYLRPTSSTVVFA